MTGDERRHMRTDVNALLGLQYMGRHAMYTIYMTSLMSRYKYRQHTLRGDDRVSSQRLISSRE